MMSLADTLSYPEWSRAYEKRAIIFVLGDPNDNHQLGIVIGTVTAALR